MSLGETIKDLRKHNNMSQEQLAEKLDVSRQSVSLWEKDSTQPTIDNIIMLSDIFGVSVDELLKSNEQLVSKAEGADEVEEPAVSTNVGNKKVYIIAVLDAVVLAIEIYMIWFFKSGSTDFFNVLDLHFNGSAVFFIASLPVIIGVLSALWLVTAILSFVKRKSYKIIKTVIIMLSLALFITGNIAGGFVDNSRQKEAQNIISQGVSYLDLNAFENVGTTAEYEEQYVDGQTDVEIPVNYTVTQWYKENYISTKCVEFTDNDYKNSELSRYFLELELKDEEKEFDYFSDDECKELGIAKGEYSINNDGNSLTLILIKGSRVYYCEYDNLDVITNTVKRQIKQLQ